MENTQTASDRADATDLEQLIAVRLSRRDLLKAALVGMATALGSSARSAVHATGSTLTFSEIAHGLDAAEREANAWGDTFDIGQLTLACAVGWLDFRFADFDWRAARPGLSAWFARVSARPSLAQTAPRA